MTGYLQKTASAFIKQAEKLPKEVHYVSSGPDPSVRRQVHEIGQKADPHKKKAAFRRPFRSSAASGSSGSQSGPVLSAAIPHEAQDAEAEKHHPPCRRQGSRRGDGQTSIGDAVRADTREP